MSHRNQTSYRCIYVELLPCLSYSRELVVHQTLPIRKVWEALGLSIDTYWASNLNQVVWSAVDSTIVALSSNQFASGVNAQTNQIEVIDNVDAVFYKTIVR